MEDLFDFAAQELLRLTEIDASAHQLVSELSTKCSSLRSRYLNQDPDLAMMQLTVKMNANRCPRMGEGFAHIMPFVPRMPGGSAWVPDNVAGSGATQPAATPEAAPEPMPAAVAASIALDPEQAARISREQANASPYENLHKMSMEEIAKSFAHIQQSPGGSTAATAACFAECVQPSAASQQHGGARGPASTQRASSAGSRGQKQKKKSGKRSKGSGERRPVDTNVLD